METDGKPTAGAGPRAGRGWIRWTAALVLLAACGALLWTLGPHRHVKSACRYCGRTRLERWRCGIKVRDQVEESDLSGWVDDLCPMHSEHKWQPYYVEHGHFLRATIRSGHFRGFVLLRFVRAHETALGRDKAVEIVMKYRGSLAEEDPAVAHRMANSLWREDIIPALEERAESADPAVRRAAEEALAKISDQ
jgi:hypothetical protein